MVNLFGAVATPTYPSLWISMSRQMLPEGRGQEYFQSLIRFDSGGPPVWGKLEIIQGIGIPDLIENLKTLQTTCSNIKEDLHLEPDPFEFLHQSLREDRKKWKALLVGL